VQHTPTTCRNLALTEFERDLMASRLCNDLPLLDDELADFYVSSDDRVSEYILNGTSAQ